MKKTLIVIGGPTAIGKTSVAIQLALHFGTEILSADSRQCYTELNIGVAKPSLDELQKVKHHFINSHSIHNEVSAGVYETYALNCLQSLFEKKDVVIAVGGTGLYLKALCEGIDPMPAVDKAIESEIEKKYNEYGISWLQEELKSKDPKGYSNIDQLNPHRMLRALSFAVSSGESISDYQKSTPKERPFSIVKFAMNMNREELYDRINQRVDIMMKEGLLDEVKSLRPHNHLKSLQTVGYSELFHFLNGENTLEFAVEKIKQHSRNYAKRQITWFKNQSDYTWVDSNEAFDSIIKKINY